MQKPEFEIIYFIGADIITSSNGRDTETGIIPDDTRPQNLN